MQIKTLFAIAMVSLVMVGCDKQEEQHSVSYYQEHKEERAKKIAECNENIGGIGLTPNCQNAKQADYADLMGDKNAPSPFKKKVETPMPKMGRSD